MGAINTEMHDRIRSLHMDHADMAAALFAADQGQAVALDWALNRIMQMRSELDIAEETIRSMVDDIVDLKVKLGEA